MALPFYFTTLTYKGGVPPALIDAAILYFKRCDQCLAVIEYHDNGNEHLHALHTDTNAQTGGVTRKFERMYAKAHLDVVKGVSIVVKHPTNKIGLFHYLTKALGTRQPIAVVGWKWTWIQAQCRENLKCMPKKILMKGVRWVTQRECTNLMLEYAKLSARVIDSKITFTQVFADMVTAGYQFDSVKIIPVYIQCVARSGDSRPAVSYVENQLQFLV